ncbi:hypothetical protein AMECASPLE_035314 [Ameca splendens]|uniref:Uncharacterized protein n=1 Tax=Ameca splendens TaxID=208324 RepID=A0ABV0YIE4_9TELE
MQKRRTFVKEKVLFRSVYIHSFIFYTVYSIVGHGGAGAYFWQSTGERRGTPSTGRQSIAGQLRDIKDKQQSTHPFTPKGNLERPVNLTVMFLDCGRKPEYPVRTHACTGRTFKLHAERPQDFLAARQQCYQLRHTNALQHLYGRKYFFKALYMSDEFVLRFQEVLALCFSV